MGYRRHLSPLKLSITSILILAILIPQPLLARTSQSDSSSKSSQEKKDSDESQQKKEVYPRKVPSRAAWEYIVNIPGYILYFPFWLVYTAATPIIGWVETSNAMPRVKDFLESDDGKRMAYPTGETQYGIGVTYKHKDLFRPDCNIIATGMVGLNWRRMLQFELYRYRIGGPFTFNLGAQHIMLTDANFFGIGNDSLKQDRRQFAHRQPAAWIAGGLDLGRKLTLLATFRIEANSISEGRGSRYESITGLPPEYLERLPGLYDKADFFISKFELRHDSLNRLGRRPGGWLIFLNASLHDQLNGEAYNFYKARLDLTRFQHLFYGRSLVVRAAAEVTRPFKEGEVPFYYWSKLGERRTIRGYSRGRFRDRDSILFSLEYRYPLLKRPGHLPSLQATLFLDTGKVSHDLFAEPFLKHYHTSFGGGFRIFNQKGLNLQILVARSRDGWRFYLVLNE
jgi:hypothetical protein